MAGYCTNVCMYFHEPQASENTARVQYPAIFPSQPSNSRFIILYHSDFSIIDSYCACVVQRLFGVHI